VLALVRAPAGQNLLGTRGPSSWTEYAALWGKVHGVECRFERLDRQILEQAVPGGIGEEMADMFEYISEFGYDGSDPSVVLPKDVCIDSRKASAAMSNHCKHSSASPFRFPPLRITSSRRIGNRSCDNVLMLADLNGGIGSYVD
jgi:hypothetical protein